MHIVLIGGLWLTASAWDAVVPELTALGHTPVPVALPGQGDGDASATLDDQVAAVLAAIDAAPEPAVVEPRQVPGGWPAGPGTPGWAADPLRAARMRRSGAARTRPEPRPPRWRTPRRSGSAATGP